MNSVVKGGTEHQVVVEHFWRLVGSLDQDGRSKLLRFVTGSPTLPIGGFGRLQGTNGEPRPFTLTVLDKADPTKLPTASTW